jgi:hypothetical protein
MNESKMLKLKKYIFAALVLEKLKWIFAFLTAKMLHKFKILTLLKSVHALE